MAARGGRDRSPEKYCDHVEALAFIAEAREWTMRTGTAWSHLCMMANVHASVRGSVEQRGNGMLRSARNALAEVMERHPGGIVAADVGLANDKLTAEETAAVAQEVQAWLERTGTAPWRLATATGRTSVYLIEWLRKPRLITIKAADRFRAVMAEHPDGMGHPVHDETRTVDDPPPPPLLDPLAERRGEAERRRAQWVAQQAAEHQRKYGRPLGRSIEEMVA
jgi:hypothetical protein